MNYDINNILYAIISLGFLAYLAPRVFRMNQGVVLRNIGLLLAAFALLGLFYKNFGPESEHPLFKMPEAMALRQQAWQKSEEKAKEQSPDIKDNQKPESAPDNGGVLGKPSDVIKGI